MARNASADANRARNERRWRAQLALLVIWTMLSSPANAYIDPGSGSMVVQAVIAIGATVVFYFRNPLNLLRDIKAWLASKRNR